MGDTDLNSTVDSPKRVRPPYESLPIIGRGDIRHSWDYFGRADQVGTLGDITAADILRAADLVVSGRAFSLSIPLNEPDPPIFNRGAVTHTIFRTHTGNDDRLDNFYPQGSSQWDGLRHVRFNENGYFGGRKELVGDELGIQNWAKRGIVSHGVLLDLAAYRRAKHSSYDPFGVDEISAADLREVADYQGVTLSSGDVLCIRFGWLEHYRSLPDSEKIRLASPSVRPQFVGLAPTADIAEYLWDSGVVAVTADNPAVEAWGHLAGLLHRRLIPCLGMALGELFDFSALSKFCSHSNRWQFMFNAAPLNLGGGVGSTANSLAVV